MIALSWSAMQDAQCPFRFNALRIAKTYREPASDPLIIGSKISSILQQYRQHCCAKGRESDLDFLLGITPKVPFENDVDERVAELVERFINTQLVNIPYLAPWIRIEAKLAFRADLTPLPEKDGWFSKEAAFRAVSDSAYVNDGALWIVDDKSGMAETNKQQLDIYAHLLQPIASSKPGGRFSRVVCVMNELGRGKVETVAEYPAGPVEGVRELILGKIEEVNSWTEFPAVACSQCRYCTVPDCPIRSEVEQALIVSSAEKEIVPAIPSSLATREQAEQAVQFLVFADQITNRVKDLLRTWVEEHGPVVACGKIAELRENRPWKALQLEKIAGALKAWGVPVESIWGELSLSESAIEKLLKKRKLLDRLPMILSLGERKDYKPKFGLYNDKLS